MSKMKTSDIRRVLKERGFEMGTRYVLEQMADELVGLREANIAMAQLMNQMTNVLTDMSNVGDAMAKQMNEIRRKDDQFRQYDNEE